MGYIGKNILEKLNPWMVEKFKKLNQARSRLYRSQISQVNTRWKALAEIYTYLRARALPLGLALALALALLDRHDGHLCTAFFCFLKN